jgi:3-oxoacyl-[acyl-carrier-protein] synthase-3
MLLGPERRWDSRRDMRGGEHSAEAPVGLAVSTAAADRRGMRVASLATAIPRRVVTNTAVAERLGVDADWIVKRTGIRQRHYAGPGESLSGLAAEAARRALADADLDPLDVDLVLVATCSQDDLLPNAAPVVAGAIGAEHAGALDLGAACTGFLSGLVLAAALLEAGRASNVVLVGAEVLSRYLDPADRRAAPLFGDGAGAVVLRATDGPGCLGAAVLGADASGWDFIRIARSDSIVRLRGGATFKHAVATLADVTLRALSANGLAVSDIDAFVYHQANGRIVWSVAERLGLPADRVIDAIGPTGNTSAASIPLALAFAREEDRLHPGDTVLLAAVGAGFTWGATVVQWGGSA